jgi:hypothetical protein
MIDTQSDLQTVIKARNGQMVVKRTQDVTPYLEANKAARNSFSDWRPFAKQGMRQVAEIPNIVVEKWDARVGCERVRPQSRQESAAVIELE